jgi:hypothetical protein
MFSKSFGDRSDHAIRIKACGDSAVDLVTQTSGLLLKSLLNFKWERG